MSIDVRQFHQTFFEESLESAAHMEAQLLALETAIDRAGGSVSAGAHREALDTVFRGAHSIKGAAATFGFGTIAEFTHLLESMLDTLRAGDNGLNSTLIATLLQATDCLRAMISGARAGEKIDESLATRIATIRAALNHGATLSDVSRAKTETPDPIRRHYRISFRPHHGFFQTGNDPLRILRELAALGELKTSVTRDELPEFPELDPEACYLGWMLELSTEKPRAVIDDIFAWVTGDAELSIDESDAKSSEARARGERRAIDRDLQQGSIRVAVPKVDALVDLVGELVITQSMLNQLAVRLGPDSAPEFVAGLSQLERNTRELQESVMSIRMLPIGFVFNRLPRLVRDISRQLGKKVELQMSGERTELDKTVIERITDPLMHLMRNCLDHGIESPAQRRAVGKSEMAKIRIDAYQKGGSVVVEIEDDGQGLNRDKIRTRAIERGLIDSTSDITDEQLIELIFLPGFSTAEAVSDLSGRGVGMDVVRNNIRQLGGNVEVSSTAGQGTRFTMRLPLTLAIVDGLSVAIGERTFILPLVSIVESIRISEGHVTCPAGGPPVFALRNEYLPLIRLHQIFGIATRANTVEDGILVIIESDGRKAGLLVDDLRDQQQVVIKSLETHYQRVDGVAAATILGDGTVALILDAASLIRRAHLAKQHDGSAPDFRPGSVHVHRTGQPAVSGPHARS